MPKNAIIKKTNINGDETLYIPLSVGSSNFNAEEFQALVVELINIFKQHPNTPVYLQIFDTIHAEMLLVERADVFKYVHEDFLEEDDNKYSEKQKAEFKDAFAKKVVTYRDRALEIVRKNAEKKRKKL